VKVDKSFYEKFEIDLSSLCNLECPLCVRNYTHAQNLMKPYRPLKEITDQLDTFPNLKYSNIAGMLSEPSMYKDFIPFIEYLNKRNIQKEIHVNGDLHNDSYWEDFVNILQPEDIVYLTICGSTQEIHEKYRVNSSLKRVIEVAEILKEKVIIQIIIFEYNKDDISNIEEMFQDYNTMIIVSESFKLFDVEYIDNPQDDISVPHNIRSAVESLYRMKYNKKGTISCSYMNNKMITISSDGTEWACHIQAENNIPFDYDYSDILEYSHLSCVGCEKQVFTILDKLKIDKVT